MSLQLGNNSAGCALTDIKKAVYMADKIHIIRHTNARKLLDTNCNGVVRKFADAIGKSEQQCSNFLRLKNPVNIGDSVAREIEFAFGYPNKWLDIEESADQGAASYVNIEILNHFNDMEEAVTGIGSTLIDGVGFADALLIIEKFDLLSVKQQKLVRHAKSDLKHECLNLLRRQLRPNNLKITDEPSALYDLITDKAVFRIVTGRDEGTIASYPQTDLFSEFRGNKLSFEVFPIMFKGEPKLVFIHDTSLDVPDFMETDDYAIWEIIHQFNDWEKMGFTRNILDYINTHPLLNDNKTT